MYIRCSDWWLVIYFLSINNWLIWYNTVYLKSCVSPRQMHRGLPCWRELCRFTINHDRTRTIKPGKKLGRLQALTVVRYALSIALLHCTNCYVWRTDMTGKSGISPIQTDCGYLYMCVWLLVNYNELSATIIFLFLQFCVILFLDSIFLLVRQWGKARVLFLFLTIWERFHDFFFKK